MNWLKITLFLLVPSFVSSGQEPHEAIYIRKSTNINIELANGDFTIDEHHISEKKFNDNLIRHTRESVFYSDFDPITSIEVETLIPNGAKLRRIKASTIETKDIVQPGIFYGGYRRKDFVFPGVVSGAIGKLEYTKRIKDVHLLTPFYFDEDVQVKEAEFSVTFPEGVNIKYKVYGDLGDKVQFVKSSNKNKVNYVWKMSDIPAYKDEANAPGRAYRSTHVVIFVESFDIKGETRPVLSGVSDLYNWYGKLIDKIPDRGNLELRQKVEDLTRSCGTDNEKVKSIFHWVQDNIKYIAFEQGMAGFVPRAAEDVFIKRYGDCKDMANLLKTMISEAGIDAYLTWIGTRSKPYSYYEIPTTVTDNHMICAVKIDNHFVFLDATDSFIAFGKPSAMIQGKEALVGIDDVQFEIIKVPILGAAENDRLDISKIEVDELGVRGNFSSTLSGYDKNDFQIARLKAEIKTDTRYLVDFFRIGSDNIIMNNVALSGVDEQDLPGAVTFDFLLPGYGKRVGDRMFINLNLNRSLPGEIIDIESRTADYENNYKRTFKSITTLTLPDGYKAEMLPANSSDEWPDFMFSSTYKINGHSVVHEKIISLNYISLSKSKFESWNDFIQQVNNLNLQSITLIKSP